MFQLLRLVGDPAKLFLCLSILLMDKPVFTQKAADLGFADGISVLTGKTRQQTFQAFWRYNCAVIGKLLNQNPSRPDVFRSGGTGTDSIADARH